MTLLSMSFRQCPSKLHHRFCLDPTGFRLQFVRSLASHPRNRKFAVVSKSHFPHFHTKALHKMEAIKQTVAQNLGVSGAHELVPEHQQFSLEQTPDLSGKVAVITGGSEGIGYGCSHTLLSHNIAKVFIISLSKDVVDGTVKAIEEEMGEEAAKKVEWLQCDLADWNHVLKTADTIAKGTDRVDIIINNAARGIMTYQVTDLGVDRHVDFPYLSCSSMADSFEDGSEPCRARTSDVSTVTYPERHSIERQHCAHRQLG